LVGESGSGKSTIGRMLVGLLTPSSGKVEINGVNLATETDADKVDLIRSDIQMIFQDPFASLNPRWRVRDIIVEPVVARGGDAAGLAEKLLVQVGLSALDAGKFPHEFSGGQRQRICIARALSSEPKLIVCDEPTSALDVSVQAQVLNLMSDLKDNFGLTYVLISHDLTVVQHMADRIGVLYLGRLVEEASPEDLFNNTKHPYTKMLLEAAPRMDGFGREADLPVGEIPDPIDPPQGCAFNPRCPIATNICRQERPIMRQLGDIRVACHLAD
jgi:oligopeptide/dipeptide ABC transporter ATP-binding protein